MTNLINPLAGTASAAMAESKYRLQLSGERLATGAVGPSAVAEYAIGDTLRISSLVLRGVMNNANYGVSLLTKARNDLQSTINIMAEVRNTLAQANTAMASLPQLSAIYISKMTAAQNIMANGMYDTRPMFSADLDLEVRVGEAATNIITINITKADTQDLVDAVLTAQAAIANAAEATTADAELVTAITGLQAVLGTVSGQIDVFQTTIKNLNDLITVLDDAAGLYLITNYEEEATIYKSEVLATRGSINVLQQGFQIAEATLGLLQ